MNDAAKPAGAARPMTPQENLRAARSGLATALAAASAAVNEPNANAAMIGAAMTGLAQAQQNYNNAVIRIPLRIMTDGEIPPADTASPGPEEATRLHAVDAGEAKALPENELLESTNARKWADHFLAVNKNKAIDRESLVGWFANAIETGRQAQMADQSRSAAIAPPEDPFAASINRLAGAIEKAADRLR